MSFGAQKCFINVVQFTYFLSCFLLSDLIIHYQIWNYKDLPLDFKSFIDLVVIFYIVDTFWFNFCTWYEALFQLYSLVCDCPFFSATFVEKTIFPHLNGLGTFVKNQLAIDVCVYFWILKSSIPLVYISTLMLVTHWL